MDCWIKNIWFENVEKNFLETLLLRNVIFSLTFTYFVSFLSSVCMASIVDPPRPITNRKMNALVPKEMLISVTSDKPSIVSSYFLMKYYFDIWEGGT